jgi:hypothetical protein
MVNVRGNLQIIVQVKFIRSEHLSSGFILAILMDQNKIVEIILMDQELLNQMERMYLI